MARAAIHRCHWSMRILLVRVDAGQYLSRRGLPAMTLHAPTHSQRSKLLDAVHLGNVAVAGLACDPFGHMPLVREINVIRKFVNPDPLDGFAVIISLGDLLDVGAIRFDHPMTVHTDIE